MKEMISFALGWIIIVVTYYLSLIASSMDHSAEPSEYFAFTSYLLGVCFIIYAILNDLRRRRKR